MQKFYNVLKLRDLIELDFSASNILICLNSLQ